MAPPCGAPALPDGDFIELSFDSDDDQHLRHGQTEETVAAPAGFDHIVIDDVGFARLASRDPAAPTLKAGDLFRMTMHVCAQTGQFHVHDREAGTCTLLSDMQRNHKVMYPLMELDMKTRLKCYVQGLNIGGGYVFWACAPLWRALSFQGLSYKRGGADSCRHLLDRWPSWLLWLQKLDISADHMQKARTATRGRGSVKATWRIFPELTWSTFAVVAILIRLAATMEDLVNSGRAETMLQSIVRQWIPHPVDLKLFLSNDVHVVAGRDISAEADFVLLPMQSAFVDTRNLTMPPSCARYRGEAAALKDPTQVPVATFLVLLFASGSISALKQIVHQLATAVENDFEAYAKATLSACNASVTPSPRKRKDVHATLEIYSTDIRKKARVEDRPQKAAVVAAMAERSNGDEGHGIRMVCWRYWQSFRSGVGMCGDIAIAFDGVRALGKDYLLTCILNPSGDRVAAWCPPQERCSVAGRDVWSSARA